MRIHTHTKVHWIFWPFSILFGFIGLIIGLVGKLVGAVIGFALAVTGFAFTMTIIGAGIGIPLMIFGVIMMLISIF